MVSAVVGGLRVVSVYAPNGRTVGSPFFAGKLAWYDRLHQWLRDTCDPLDDIVIGGDFNIAPTDDDVWDPAAVHGGTHVSVQERAAFDRLLAWGLIDAYRASTTRPGATPGGTTARACSTRTSGCASTICSCRRRSAERVVDAEIDREARKGPPVPSDHAPLSIDLDEPGVAFDPDWAGALERIARRTR